MAIKGAPHHPKPQHHWNLTIRMFSVISRTLGGVSYPSAEVLSVYSTAPADGARNHASRSQKATKRQDRNPKAICFDNKKTCTTEMKNKAVETEGNVYERTVRIWRNEMWFTSRKAKLKQALTQIQNKMWLNWAEKKNKTKQNKTILPCRQLESTRICIVLSDDTGTFLWYRSSETYKDDCPKKTSKFKGPREITIIITTINVHVYIENLDKYLNPSVGN